MISKAPKWLKPISILMVTLAAMVLLQLPANAQTGVSDLFAAGAYSRKNRNR